MTRTIALFPFFFFSVLLLFDFERFFVRGQLALGAFGEFVAV